MIIYLFFNAEKVFNVFPFLTPLVKNVPSGAFYAVRTGKSVSSQLILDMCNFSKLKITEEINSRTSNPAQIET